MTTASPAYKAEQIPAAAESRLAAPPLGVILGRAFASWAMWATVIVSALIGLESDLGLGRLFTAALMAFLGFAFVSLGEGLVILLWKGLGFLLPRLRLGRAAAYLRTIPPAIPGRLLGIFFYIAGDLLFPESFFQHIMIPPVGEMAIILAGITGVLVALARPAERPRQTRLLLFGLAFLMNLAFLTWVFQPGTDRYLPPVESPALGTVTTPELTNPGLPGPYPVQTLTYGNGTLARRPEFGAEADLITASVDGSQIFAGYQGLGGRYFHWYWGFDFTQLPLNGLAWYPEGDGPFPLVLIVHGNHAMTEPSDPGYAYLGEHLASHGYIAVSVDENFLNGIAFLDGQMDEMPLRAWLLLKHLQAWQGWNETPGNPFYGRVDLDHVALVGHSRGGEAVAAAASMNWSVAPPVSRVSSVHDFGFGIDGVVAIAPSDDHYQPFGRSLTVPYSDYLLLGGGHDADTYVLYGQAQYNRVQFGENPDGFKALAYLYQGNHGQFNTVWADRDRGWLNSLLLNRRPLLNGDEQRQAALVLVTAFLEASLRGQDGYRALFANPPAGNEWLPEGIVVTQYADAAQVEVDVGRPAPGGDTWVTDMVDAGQTRLALRDGETNQMNQALRLEWAAGSAPVLGINLDEASPAGPDDALTFALASALDEATPLAVTIELETAGGEIARLPLSRFGLVYPPLAAQIVKADWLAPLPGYKMTLESKFERVLQTYTLPLSAFQEANPAFDPAGMQTIRFLFDGTVAGAVYLDQVGLTP